MTNVLSVNIQNLIYFIRDQKVMLDSDLALIYGVKTKRLNEQMKRNIKRFPKDFCFQLSESEWQDLRSQFATANPESAKRRSLPYVFTEYGAVMLASVLDSPRAVITSVQIVRAFVETQSILNNHQLLEKRLDKLELKYDEKFQEVFFTLKEMSTSNPKRINNTIKRGIKE